MFGGYYNKEINSQKSFTKMLKTTVEQHTRH